MTNLLIPDQSEPFQRDGKVSQFWYKYLDSLTSRLNATVNGISAAIATVADVWAAEPDKTMTTGLIANASAFETLTDAATIAVDWDTFICADVELTSDRLLGNPSNGQPGTYRTILVKGSSATPRALPFDTQYLGGAPALSDITNTKWYLVTIFCVTDTHFVASARAARS